MQILILKNSKKSFENGNETKALKDSISELKENLEELSKRMINQEELAEAKKRTDDERMISLQNENEYLKINNRRMNEEIISLKGDQSSMKAIVDWKVCTLQVIFLVQFLICFH